MKQVGRTLGPPLRGIRMLGSTGGRVCHPPFPAGAVSPPAGPVAWVTGGRRCGSLGGSEAGMGSVCACVFVYVCVIGGIHSSEQSVL